MDLGLTGKVALVTAASHGLGRATALAFGREGARVAICSRDRVALDAAAAAVRSDSGADVHPFECDLANAAQIKAMVERVIAHFGTIHALVNNAGGPVAGTFEQVDDVDWQRAFDLTLMSAVRTTRAVLPHMRRQRWGRIVNISSYSVKQPIPDILLSNSLRLGAAGWAKTLASEVARDNVLINTVGPGWTRTDRVSRMIAARASGGATIADVEAQIVSEVPIGRLGEPAEVADAIVFLASERASFITGTLLTVDGGVVRSPT